MLLAVGDGRGLGEDLDVVRFADVAVLGADDGVRGPAGAPGAGIAGLAGGLHRVIAGAVVGVCCSGVRVPRSGVAPAWLNKRCVSEQR